MLNYFSTRSRSQRRLRKLLILRAAKQTELKHLVDMLKCGRTGGNTFYVDKHLKLGRLLGAVEEEIRLLQEELKALAT